MSLELALERVRADHEAESHGCGMAMSRPIWYCSRSVTVTELMRAEWIATSLVVD